MLNLLVWIALVTTAAAVFVIVINIDRNLDRRVRVLEDSIIDDVLDAVDDLCYPISDWERNEIKAFVKGE